MDSLKETLIKGARDCGICRDGYTSMFRSESTDALIDYYIQNPDWCLERNYPDIQTLTDHFSDIEDRGVFVGKTFNGEILNDKQAYIFHNCKGTVKVALNVEKCIIPMLYVANGSRLRIVGVGDSVPRRPSEVPVSIFGRNDVSAKSNKFVKFNIYKVNV
ncbi:MAG: hypothetical protein NC418_11545 [Muribaculaceae bacterium]|nr:hypothetical protein [Muribaculaceae bacterium]